MEYTITHNYGIMPKIIDGVVIPRGLQVVETYPEKVKMWVDATLTERKRIITILDNNLGHVDFDDLIALIREGQK